MLLSYRRVFVVILMAAVASGGCARTEQKYDGPTVKAFTGRLTQNGKPVSFPEGERVTLKLHLEKTPGPMGIPIQSDGSFKIGWMPIGKYDAALVRQKKASGGRGGGSPMYMIPGGLTIEDGKTEYNIELGPNWKP
jgi:hypothetical protein